MDFYQIKVRLPKKGIAEIYPDFIVKRSHDLMIRGKKFYAIWDKEKEMWSTDEYDVQRFVDADLYSKRDTLASGTNDTVTVKSLSEFSSKTWPEFLNYCQSLSDNSHQLDERLTFSNTKVKKTDYVSKRLPYPLEEGPIDAYEELISTLYSPEERMKIEWSIGSVISGESKDIQKFLVFYGEAGTGKSTIMNIIQKLFEGYYVMFDAKALTSNNNAFATEVFRSNPLVAIQHDGDLSRIEDNTKLNSIVSHEEMVVNEKYKSSYTSRFNCFLFMGTNKAVKITDAKSGIIRRLIDVKPTGNKVPPKRYNALMTQIDFELGAIANHCLNVFRELGVNYYSAYRPLDMIYKTDVFFNFVEDNFDIFKKDDGTSLKAAYAVYKQYCEDSGAEFKLPMYKFREELKNYFRDFHEVARVDGKQMRSWYSGFLTDKFTSMNVDIHEEASPCWLVLDKTESLLDIVLADCKAQYANEEGAPKNIWEKVKTLLKQIDTHLVHYILFKDKHHIVIDFDLKDENGKKSMEKNIEAASKFPPTYAEFSKSGCGIHLHYIYDGDVEKLRRLFDTDIEVKVFTGNASLRRKLSKCNDIPIAHLSSGLPLKEEKMVNFDSLKSEKALRDIILRNLRKEIHPGTKPSIDFIRKILDDAYASGLHYDISDLRPSIMAFANNSTNHAVYCVKEVCKMKFKSEEPSEQPPSNGGYLKELVFYDVEVFPNLFLVNWKIEGENHKCVRMINPSPEEVEELFKMKLVGFNCRRYDNHIMYARSLGYSNTQLYELSQRIVGNQSQNCMFGEAYNLSYTDVYDFAAAANKKSLKKFEIELGIHHQELGLPWDQPVPEDKWNLVAEYCDNDVMATEAVFNYLKADWTARQILAALSGLTVNDTTNSHSAKIIFGDAKNPQRDFVYTHLEETFPGYKFIPYHLEEDEEGKKFPVPAESWYRGEKTGEGGYVYAEPGVYTNVALLDIASMHPSSIEALDLFGPYTKKFSEIKQARIYIKHKEFDKARNMMDGKLAPFLNDESEADNLANALKTVINSVYGLTSASFDNKFRDPRNVDNIVAKRGALFMIDLKHEVQKRGFTVAHIKTDSIKIPNATEDIIQFVQDFGKKYGYNFEHEATYEKMCLVNNAVYIAKVKWHEKPKYIGLWTATGKQFLRPYVFKKLFSKEPIEFEDMCEVMSVSTALYLDFNENFDESAHDYHFVGKVGSFCPIKPGCGGALLCREKEGKYDSATGAKGYRWMESEMVKDMHKEDDIDISYYDAFCEEAITDISQYCDFNWFAENDEPIHDIPPWKNPCGDAKYETCADCPHYQADKIPPICELGYNTNN